MSDRPVAAPVGDAGRPLAMLHDRRPSGGRHPVYRPAVAIGRGAGNDLVLGDPSVSERHAALRLSDGVWTLADLGSMTGSWVDGEPVQGEVPVASGCSIRLGGVELVFAGHDRWEDSPPRPARQPRERPGFVLIAPVKRRIPVPVVVGLGIMLLALAGYLLARVG